MSDDDSVPERDTQNTDSLLAGVARALVRGGEAGFSEDVTAEVSAALAPRYLVEREIGHGGMAVVFAAADTRHARRVAIKVFRGGSGGGSAARFLREIEIAANLVH